MQNPYFVLGVQPEASREEIKSAYRRLARVFHPDMNRDDFGAQERFAEINAAYQILGDPAKRKSFDEGLIDARGKPRPTGATRGPRDPFAGVHVNRQKVEPASGETPEDIAESIFGAAFQRDQMKKEPPLRPAGGARKKLEDAPGIDDVPLGDPLRDAGSRRSAWTIFDRTLKPLFDLVAGRDDERPEAGDIVVEVDLTLREASSGTSRTVSFGDGSSATIDIPPATRDGEVLRFPGEGVLLKNGRRTDLAVVVHHTADPDFILDGADLLVDLPVTLEEAVFGARKQVATLSGDISVDIPEWSDGGTVIRIPAKGFGAGKAGRGDLLVRLQLVLPDERDEKLTDLLRLQRGDWFV